MSQQRVRLSPAAYFGCVVFVTALIFGVLMLFRPALAHSARELLGLEPQVRASPGSFFAVRVVPILQEHCVGCHGARRQKAKLRLDSYAALLIGGRHGPVITPGKLNESELYARITLPTSNERAMPPNSKPPMPTDDVTVIKLWIAAGASGVQPVAAIRGAPALVPKITFEEVDEVTVQRARAGVSQTVAQLKKDYPGLIEYESRTSANLDLNAAALGSRFGDAEVGALAPLLDRIVWANFSGTNISDASGPRILAMRNLRTLHLDNTAVTDAFVSSLTSLKALRSVTLVNTAITASSILPLRTRGVKVYDGNEPQGLATNAD